MKNQIGFTYIIEYVGSNNIISGLKYGGSKTFSKGWEAYLGSPSTKNCIKCETWKFESKTNPEDFKRTIIDYAGSLKELLTLEIRLLRSVSPDVINDPLWLNNSIPRIGAFPMYTFTQEGKKVADEKRRKTNLEKYGVPCVMMSKDIRQKVVANNLEKYGVEHPNKLPEKKIKNSIHKKEYFGQMTPDQRKIHGSKSLQNRTEEGIRRGVESAKQKRSKRTKEEKDQIEQLRRSRWEEKYYSRTESQKKTTSERCKAAAEKAKIRWVKIKFLDDGSIIQGFLKDIVSEYNIAVDGIMDRYKSKQYDKPLYSRTCKRHIMLIDFQFKSRHEIQDL